MSVNTIMTYFSKPSCRAPVYFLCLFVSGTIVALTGSFQLKSPTITRLKHIAKRVKTVFRLRHEN